MKAGLGILACLLAGQIAAAGEMSGWDSMRAVPPLLR
jgi:hypothetical protein